ncbi:uncharacterized protein BJ171DRAFT_495380 [Polychytrium aggregatum]|uniref:uncharacterized protein n=1 Tax=Polychytrium aggregatum TaxID=110093 RepID=UPI0022FF0908|nr:uncharacterized protein BJ171DRAFT_495380 [Polychytrium aggregatum]KAI9206987.1 hypothetical protein BJ171DRAFT_495380 [Polychytrium aggregatum]
MMCTPDTTLATLPDCIRTDIALLLYYCDPSSLLQLLFLSRSWYHTTARVLFKCVTLKLNDDLGRFGSDTDDSDASDEFEDRTPVHRSSSKASNIAHAATKTNSAASAFVRALALYGIPKPHTRSSRSPPRHVPFWHYIRSFTLRVERPLTQVRSLSFGSTILSPTDFETIRTNCPSLETLQLEVVPSVEHYEALQALCLSAPDLSRLDIESNRPHSNEAVFKTFAAFLLATAPKLQRLVMKIEMDELVFISGSPFLQNLVDCASRMDIMYISSIVFCDGKSLVQNLREKWNTAFQACPACPGMDLRTVEHYPSLKISITKPSYSSMFSNMVLGMTQKSRMGILIGPYDPPPPLQGIVSHGWMSSESPSDHGDDPSDGETDGEADYDDDPAALEHDDNDDQAAGDQSDAEDGDDFSNQDAASSDSADSALAQNEESSVALFTAVDSKAEVALEQNMQMHVGRRQTYAIPHIVDILQDSYIVFW